MTELEEARDKAARYHLADRLGKQDAEQAERRSRKTRKSFADLLLSRDEMLALPDPVALVDRWLYTDSLAWISGPPGEGKSFAALDIAASVATGISWHGHKVSRGNVVYVVAESPRGFKERLPAWEAAHGGHTPVTSVDYLPAPVQLADPDDVEEFTQLCVERDPALIVIDTQSRCTVGADENSARDMTVIVDAMDGIRRATGACVLVVHHTPRSAANLRGSNSQEGAATTIMSVTKDGPVVTLSAKSTKGGKQKDMEPAPDMRLALKAFGGSAALVTSVDTLTNSERLVLEALGPGDSITTPEYALSAIVKTVDASQSTVQRAVGKLKVSGHIKVTNDGRYAMHSITAQGLDALHS